MAENPWTVPLSDVLVDDEELAEAAAAAVRSGWWSAGPRVAALEQEFAELTGSTHALAVSSCTAALHLALLALGVGEGDEVVTPSLTFVAVANMIRQTGATPVFCDIAGEHDLNLDPDDLERAITPRTRAIVPLHYAGFPCDLERVGAIAASAGVPVVEDAAHAVGGTTADGRALGAVGELGAYSFFSNKNLPIGEGGMLVTDDDDLAARARLLRSHGMTTLTWDRHRGHASSYDVVTPGFNYRIDEIRAAMASVQLRRLPAWNEARRRVADRYRDALHGRAGLVVPFAGHPGREHAAHHLTVVLLPPGTDRDAVRGRLAEARIQTSVHYPPIHRFATHSAPPPRPLPVLDGVAERVLTLPLFPTLDEARQDLVVDSLLAAVA